MPRLQAANNAITTLVTSVGTEDTSLTLTDASEFPDAPARITVGSEIIEYGAINKDTGVCSSLLRGREGTTPAAHDGGAEVTQRWTAGTYEELVGAGIDNEDISLLHALLLQIDTRSLVATAWNADDMPTSLEVRDGIDVIGTISITYDANENITELVETAGGKQITYTLTWDEEKFESMSKAVVDV